MTAGGRLRVQSNAGGYTECRGGAVVFAGDKGVAPGRLEDLFQDSGFRVTLNPSSSRAAGTRTPRMPRLQSLWTVEQCA